MAERKNDPRQHPRDYETPRTPEGTPPVIRPDDGEEASENAHDTADAARKALEKRQRKRADREGAGEEELDSTRPERGLPPG